MVVYNVMAASCERDSTRGPGIAAKVYRAMKEDKLEPEIYTCATLLSTFERAGMTEETEDIENMLQKLTGGDVINSLDFSDFSNDGLDSGEDYDTGASVAAAHNRDDR